MTYMQKMFPKFMGKMVLREISSKLDHEKYGLCPKYPPPRCNIIISDEISLRLMNGKVKVKQEIKKLTKTDVVFVDDSVVHDVDAIICATGYIPKFPYLSEDIVGEDKEQLYLTMFPRQRETSTLAVIGNFRVKDAALPVMELQARYVARVFKVSLFGSCLFMIYTAQSNLANLTCNVCIDRSCLIVIHKRSGMLS